MSERRRGYLWESLDTEITDLFSELTPRVSLTVTDCDRDRRARNWWLRSETRAEDIAAQPHLRASRQTAWRARRGITKTDEQCSRDYCRQPRAAGVKLCERHREIAQRSYERKRGMKERLPDERTGITHHFVITAKCDRKKCRNSEIPRPECSQCNGEGVYQFGGYITANYYTDGPVPVWRLAEIFVRAGKAGATTAWLDQWAIAVSIALQFGAPVDDVFKKFVAQTFEPSGPTRNPQIKRCSSVTDYVARWCLLKFGSDELRERVLAMAGGAPEKMIAEVQP